MLQMMFVVLQMTELSYDRRRFLHLRKTRFNRSQLVKNNVNELHAFFFFTDIYKGETFTVDFWPTTMHHAGIELSRSGDWVSFTVRNSSGPGLIT